MRLTSLTSLLVLVALGSPAVADPVCVPAVAGPSVARLPDPWPQAVARLVRSTARSGHPWSCGGGAIDLALDATGATLTVGRRGDLPIVRRLTDADEVVPLGQALLSLPPEPAVAPPPTPTPETLPETPNAQPTQPDGPRVVVGAGLDVRAAGGANAVLVGGTLSAGLPLDRWLATLQVRYGAALSRRDGLVDLDVGAGLARVVSWSALDLRAGLTAGAAVLLRDLPRPQDLEARVDPRVGAELAVVLPLSPRWHPFARLQAQWSPGRGPDRAIASSTTDTRTPYPFFTAGITLGVEVWR